MRIGGIASGMDTEQMVKDLMRAERVRVDKYFRQEEALKWKRDALNLTNKTLAEFILKARSDFGLTVTSSTGSLANRTSASFDWVKKASSSSEAVGIAKASTRAMEGVHKITVDQVATVASVAADNIESFIGEDGKFTVSGDITIITKAGERTFTLGTGKIETMDKLVSEINNATIEANDKTSLGIRAAYDRNLGKLLINSKSTGEQTIAITDATGLFTNAKNTEGKDAVVKYGDDTTELKSSNNNFSIFGIDFTAKGEGVTTITVETNTDGIMNKVRGFVDEYNKLIDDLNGKLKQKSYRDFQPLTKEEREVMKDKEIELWEEKAKSGLLRNDETITRVLQSMRSGLYDEVKGVEGLKHLTEIGITTGNYQSGGKLEINEKKLLDAISNNPQSVVDLLFKTPDSTIPEADKRANTGLVERLFDDMIVGMKEIVRRSGTGEDASLFRNVKSNMLIDFVTSGSISVMDRDIMGIGSRIANEERILMGREDRYWRQFTAMEKALEKMNQQSGWLMSQLGQMGR